MQTLLMALADSFNAQHACLATAESCTGGLVSAAVTSLPGSSTWFDAAFITYSNAAKETMLGVPPSLIEAKGAVSCEVAEAMAKGALRHSQATHALSITGIAGPGGGSADKPVGMVCFGFARKDAKFYTKIQRFSGNREQIRELSCRFALEEMLFFSKNENKMV